MNHTNRRWLYLDRREIKERWVVHILRPCVTCFVVAWHPLSLQAAQECFRQLTPAEACEIILDITLFDVNGFDYAPPDFKGICAEAPKTRCSKLVDTSNSYTFQA